VHALPSSQTVPSGASGFEQVPFAGSHVPATWQASLAVQMTGSPPVHTPAWQASTSVHALPSSQPVPSGAVGFEQTPLVGSQVPTAWHASLAVQVTGFEPTQAPAWQAYWRKQAFDPGQALPFGAASASAIWSAGGEAATP
jgi:hypothetical protein